MILNFIGWLPGCIAALGARNPQNYGWCCATVVVSWGCMGKTRKTWWLEEDGRGKWKTQIPSYSFELYSVQKAWAWVILNFIGWLPGCIAALGARNPQNYGWWCATVVVSWGCMGKTRKTWWLEEDGRGSEKHKFPPTLLNFIANSLGIGDFELYRLAAWMHRCSWSKESPELSGWCCATVLLSWGWMEEDRGFGGTGMAEPSLRPPSPAALCHAMCPNDSKCALNRLNFVIFSHLPAFCLVLC